MNKIKVSGRDMENSLFFEIKTALVLERMCADSSQRGKVMGASSTARSFGTPLHTMWNFRLLRPVPEPELLGRGTVQIN